MDFIDIPILNYIIIFAICLVIIAIMIGFFCMLWVLLKKACERIFKNGK
jgi:hypothetical protein